MVTSFGYTVMQLGYFVSFIAFVYAMSYLLLVKIAFKMFTLKRLLIISNLVLGLGLFIPVVHSASFQWWAVFPICSSIGISYICILTLISDTADDSSQGAAMGIATSVTAASVTLGSLAAGLLSIISIDFVFIFVAILPLISCFYIIPKFISASAK
jgi:predicted MFS family arabinose efflux permease